jgi:hypothetical protein
LSTGAYFVGSAALVVGLLAVGNGAWRLRGALLPAWTDGRGRLVEIVMAVTAIVTVAQLLGSFHAFSRGPMLIGTIAVGELMWFAATRVHRPAAVPDAIGVDVREEPRREVWVAVVAIAIVGAQWAVHTIGSLNTGMLQPDTLWYHSPFAARFVQEHAFVHLGNLGYESSRAFPFDSELVHAILILPFNRDVLSPLVNLGWAALTLLAAWCIGRTRGVGALAVIGATIVLAVPVMADIEPGQASNDLMCTAFLLCAVALLLLAEGALVPTALGGLAAALALGTKLTGAAVVGTITIGLLIVAIRHRRFGVALAWLLGLLPGAYWFVRNWVGQGNPLPWFGVKIGPITLTKTIHEPPSSLISLASRSGWNHVYLPGLEEAFGMMWWFVGALFLAGTVILIARGPGAIARILGFASLAGGIAYASAPLTGGFGFVFNVRYLAPSMIITLVVLPFHLANTNENTRWWVALGGAGLVLLDGIVAPGNNLTAWPTDYLVQGILVALAGLALWFVLRHRTWRRPAIAGGVAIVLAVLAFWPLQRHYEERRYVATSLTQDLPDNFFRNVHDARVGVFGTFTYPMFGVDLSNRVEQLEAPRTTSALERCRLTRAMLADNYDYIVITANLGFVGLVVPPVSEQVFSGDPAATVVARDQVNQVLHITRALNPSLCTEPRGLTAQTG